MMTVAFLKLFANLVNYRL